MARPLVKRQVLSSLPSQPEQTARRVRPWVSGCVSRRVTRGVRRIRDPSKPARRARRAADGCAGGAAPRRVQKNIEPDSDATGTRIRGRSRVSHASPSARLAPPATFPPRGEAGTRTNTVGDTDRGRQSTRGPPTGEKQNKHRGGKGNLQPTAHDFSGAPRAAGSYRGRSLSPDPRRGFALYSHHPFVSRARPYRLAHRRVPFGRWLRS